MMCPAPGRSHTRAMLVFRLPVAWLRPCSSTRCTRLRANSSCEAGTGTGGRVQPSAAHGAVADVLLLQGGVRGRGRGRDPAGAHRQCGRARSRPIIEKSATICMGHPSPSRRPHSPPDHLLTPSLRPAGTGPPLLRQQHPNTAAPTPSPPACTATRQDTRKERAIALATHV